ncbi:hypothetical protein AB0L44_47005 [Nonomuraea wenchangensis]|uniref:hypothetical protein n=1 Tax=Nonomuraea wenchangensis TaxID=568860 RepID=UPI003437543B
MSSSRVLAGLALALVPLISACTQDVDRVRPSAAPASSTAAPSVATPEGEHEELDATAYVEVCADRKTEIRVRYRPCDDALPGFVLRYYLLGGLARVPGVGEKITDASPTPRDDYIYRFRAPAQGGRSRFVMVEVGVVPRVVVCVRKVTRIRVPGSRCTAKGSAHAWYYLRLDGHVPAIDEQAADGTFLVPDGDIYRARRNGGHGSDAAIGYKG